MILAIDYLLIWAVECQQEDYLRGLESHLENTLERSRDRISKVRSSQEEVLIEEISCS